MKIEVKIDDDNFSSSLQRDELLQYIQTQSLNFFPDNLTFNLNALRDSLEKSLKRYMICCRDIRMKYYIGTGKVLFHHLMSDQYATLLYFLSHELGKTGAIQEAEKIYYLNKILHGIDVFYEVDLPDIFRFCHPVGTVLGRAKYSNYFVVFQNCTVGNNQGSYPSFEQSVAMYKGSMVVGQSHIGAGAHISAHTFVRNQNILPGMIAFGQSPNLELKPARQTVKQALFGHD